MKEKSFVSLVIYLHNNENSVSAFLERLNSYFDNNYEHYEIVCVNDFSTDNTEAKVNEFCDKHSSITLSIVNLGYHHGVEKGMNAGIDLAIGDFVFEFDYIVDNYDLALIKEAYNEMQNGNDIVFVSPSSNHSTLSSWFYRTINKNAHLSSKLASTSFILISRRAINKVASMTSTIPYRKVLYLSCGLKTKDITYTPTNNTKIDYHDENKTDTAIDSLILFTNVAYKITLTLTLVLMLIIVAVVIYTLFIYFNGRPIEGWTTTMLFIAIGFFGVFGIFVIILRYLTIITNLTFKKQSYIVESVRKVSK